MWHILEKLQIGHWNVTACVMLHLSTLVGIHLWELGCQQGCYFDRLEGCGCHSLQLRGFKPVSQQRCIWDWCMQLRDGVLLQRGAALCTYWVMLCSYDVMSCTFWVEKVSA